MLCVKSYVCFGYAPGAKNTPNTETLKHNSSKSSDQSLFLCAAFLPHVPSRQLSHSGSEFDRCTKPDMNKVPSSEHERLSKHRGTDTHALTQANKRTHPHTLLSFMCSSRRHSSLCLDQKGSKQKTNSSHTTVSCHLFFSLMNSIHLSNGEG